MDELTRWVKNLIFIILFTTFIEMFLPENNMRKYVRIITGFFIIAIFLSPLSALFGHDITSLDEIVPDNVSFGNWDKIKHRGQELSNTNRVLLKDYYEKRVASRVEEVVKLDYPGYQKKVEVEVDDEYTITGINIVIIPDNEIYIKPVEINGDIQDRDDNERNEFQEELLSLKK